MDAPAGPMSGFGTTWPKIGLKVLWFLNYPLALPVSKRLPAYWDAKLTQFSLNDST